MNILNTIRLAFWRLKLPENPEKAKRASVRRIVSRLTRGNARLRRGQYATREDLERQRERVISYDFTD